MASPRDASRHPGGIAGFAHAPICTRQTLPPQHNAPPAAARLTHQPQRPKCIKHGAPLQRHTRAANPHQRRPDRPDHQLRRAPTHRRAPCQNAHAASPVWLRRPLETPYRPQPGQTKATPTDWRAARQRRARMGEREGLPSPTPAAPGAARPMSPLAHSPPTTTHHSMPQATDKMQTSWALKSPGVAV